MADPDVQHFDKDGTWVKPSGAVRVEVTLKGGDGHPGGPGLCGGAGGTMTSASYHHLAGAGGGGAGGASEITIGDITYIAEPGPGAPGETVKRSFDAADLPDQLSIEIGQLAGYAHVITYFESGGTDAAR